MKLLLFIIIILAIDTTDQKHVHKNMDSIHTKMDSLILILEQKQDTLKTDYYEIQH